MTDTRNLNVGEPEANTAADAMPGDYEMKNVEIAPGKFVKAKRYKADYKDEEKEAEKEKREADDPTYDGDPESRPYLDERIEEAELARDSDGDGVPDCQEHEEER